MNQVDNIVLYTDTLGKEVTSPVLQVGSGSPHVVMIALQHGWELIGLDSGLQVMEQAETIGTLTLISLASPQAYLDSSRLVGQNMGPSSRQQTNMNRVHPGKKNGNIAERSAWAINQYIKSLKPDFLIDLHSYSSQSVPHAIIDPCEGNLEKIMSNWMLNSKITWYWEYDNATLTSQVLDKALSAVWLNSGVPSLTLELGPLRAFSPKEAQLAKQTLTNVLIICGAIKGDLKNQTTEDFNNKSWQRSEIIYSGKFGGYLRPLKQVMTAVKKGEVIAEIVTPSGLVADKVTAPHNGIHFVWHDEYRVMSGSLLGTMLIKHLA